MNSYIERLAWGTDAGFYRYVPEEVLHPATEKQVQQKISSGSSQKIDRYLCRFFIFLPCLFPAAVQSGGCRNRIQFYRLPRG